MEQGFVDTKELYAQIGNVEVLDAVNPVKYFEHGIPADSGDLEMVLERIDDKTKIIHTENISGFRKVLEDLASGITQKASKRYCKILYKEYSGKLNPIFKDYDSPDILTDAQESAIVRAESSKNDYFEELEKGYWAKISEILKNIKADPKLCDILKNAHEKKKTYQDLKEFNVLTRAYARGLSDNEKFWPIERAALQRHLKVYAASPDLQRMAGGEPCFCASKIVEMVYEGDKALSAAETIQKYINNIKKNREQEFPVAVLKDYVRNHKIASAKREDATALLEKFSEAIKYFRDNNIKVDTLVFPSDKAEFYIGNSKNLLKVSYYNNANITDKVFKTIVTL